MTDICIFIESCTFDINTDYYGGSDLRFDDVPTPCTCSAMCLNNTACLAYSWQMDGSQRCWLKLAATDGGALVQMKRVDFISGNCTRRKC